MIFLRVMGLVLMGVGVAWGEDEERRARAAELGRALFLDTGLSEPRGTACVSCHVPSAAFADPRAVSMGAVAGRVGKRNAPSLMYATLIPSMVYEDILFADGEEIYAWEGGLFLDGRARDLFEQVQGPLFDAEEMNLGEEAVLAERIRGSEYAAAFEEWVGAEAWGRDEVVAYFAYRALVAFLQEPLFRPFDARIDDYLAGDEGALSEAERRGLVVFEEKGKCADCHLLEARNWPRPLLSDFGYDNLGLPSGGEVDRGLADVVGDEEEVGKFRAPSLRNVSLTGPYMHDGSFASLREVMEFYNERDVTPERWGASDFPATVNREDFGDLKLSPQEVDDLLALMGAFTDRSLLDMKEAGRLLPEGVGGDGVGERDGERVLPDWTFRYDPVFLELGREW